MPLKFFLQRGEKKTGPFTSEQIKTFAKDGKLQPSDLIYDEDGRELPVNQIPNLQIWTVEATRDWTWNQLEKDRIKREAETPEAAPQTPTGTIIWPKWLNYIRTFTKWMSWQSKHPSPKKYHNLERFLSFMPSFINTMIILCGVCSVIGHLLVIYNKFIDYKYKEWDPNGLWELSQFQKFQDEAQMTFFIAVFSLIVSTALLIFIRMCLLAGIDLIKVIADINKKLD